MINKLIILLLCSCLCCAAKDNGNVEILNLPKGSNCTWNGLNGVCTSAYRCASAKEDILNKNYPPICSYEGVKPVICCTDCKSNDYVNLIPKVNMSYYKTGEKARDNCLDYIKYATTCEDRADVFVFKGKHSEKNCNSVVITAYVISGGRNAELDNYPHMALLGYGDNLKTAQWLCGGSLISDKYILTAAHCISSPAVGSVKYIRLGTLNRTETPELLRETYMVKRSIPHPQYKSPSKYHDIALLETHTKVVFYHAVIPACLPLEQDSYIFAEAIGWGALGYRQELAETLQTVELEIFNEEECARAYPPHRHLPGGYNHTTQMCFGHREDPKDTCEGDSGGPLQVENQLSSCMFTVIGVTSYGRPCGSAGGSGMYTRVYHYVPWIESIVWP